jgi:acylphosphatase
MRASPVSSGKLPDDAYFMNENICKRFRVSGRVQGVYYRASAAAEGKRLGLRGWALNLPDGNVEVLACGTARRVAEFAEWLQHGPRLAKVTSVEESPEDASQFGSLAQPPGAVHF